MARGRSIYPRRKPADLEKQTNSVASIVDTKPLISSHSFEQIQDSQALVIAISKTIKDKCNHKPSR